MQECSSHFDECGFARAIRANDRVQLAGSDIEGYIMNGQETTLLECSRYILKLKRLHVMLR